MITPGGKSRFFVHALSALAVLLVSACGFANGDNSQPTVPATVIAGPTRQADDGAASTGRRVNIGVESAIVWGEGEYGVVLVHGAAYSAASWDRLGNAAAQSGIVAIAVENATHDAAIAAVDYLKQELGATATALLGASAGGAAVLEVGATNEDSVDQLILLSATGTVENLGDFPKLFIASEGEGIAEQVRRMAHLAPGNRNDAVILPGDAHAQAIFDTDQGERLIMIIIERLNQGRSANLQPPVVRATSPHRQKTRAH
ncbi:MAG: alpha/beta fold hydrolase [Chloroflexia bacterium]